MKYLITLLLMLTFSGFFTVQAIQIEEIELELAHNQHQLIVPIINNNKLSQLYSITINEVTFPDANSKVVKIAPKEIVTTPALFRLLPKQRKNITLKYTGPGDQQERYYRLAITESPYLEQTSSGEQVTSLGIISKIEPLLIVRPRQQQLTYRFNYPVLKNTGNGYLVMLLDDKCGKEPKVTHYLAPGKSYTLPRLSPSAKVSLVIDQKLVVLINKCAKK